ncbi:MAG TPA: hypothetical protein VER55_15760, partial [Ardenticatenaceae bacterium]|nr:hypothetical protein [Ardenticatenaceae bacterium]
MAVGRPERKLFCPRCGAANSSNASACQACGQDLRLVAAAVIRRRPVRRRSVYVAGAGVLQLLLVSLGAWWLLQARSRAVEQAQLDHYLNGVRATEVGRWDLAAAEFAAAGQYRDAPRRRSEAESRLGQVEERYEDALAALGRGDTWQAAFALFQVVQAVPSYRDAVEVLDRARAELGPLLLFRRAAPDGGTPVVSTPEGGEQDVLTDGPGLPTAAEIAANGRHVLVEIVRNGRSDLWLWQLRSDGRLAPEDGQLLATRARDAWGRFSPDSRWLLFGWQGERGWSLATVAARGGQAARLVRDADFVAGAFAATGDAIGFRAREEGRWRLGLVEPGSEEPEHLVRDADEFGALEISPDGRHVLYGYVRDGSYRLKLRPVDSAEAFEPAPDSEFVWARFSPDGRRLLVWIWQNHLGQLVLTDMQGQRERVLASGAADAWGEFSPDGREIVYGVWNGRTWRVMLVGTQADGEIVLAEAVDDAQASFAPGGRWLLYSLWQN